MNKCGAGALTAKRAAKGSAFLTRDDSGSMDPKPNVPLFLAL